MLFSNRLIPILALFLCFTLLPATILADTKIPSSPSINEVVIDGRWTMPNEWTDATEFSDTRGKRLFGYFFIKDDKEFVYVLIDYIADKTIDDEDFAKMRFDGSNDKALPTETGCSPFGSCYGDIPGTPPQVNDYIISMVWNGGTVSRIIAQGNGKEWVEAEKIPSRIKTASTNDAENDPHSNSPHLLYEFAIPRSIFGNISEIGFSSFVVDKGERNLGRAYMSIPSLGSYFKPLSWVTLSLATPYKEPTLPPTTTSPMPTSTPTPTPNTTNPSPTITTTKTTVIKTTTEVPVPNDSFFTQIPVGYIILGGIIVIISITLAGILFIKKRSPSKEN